MKFMCTYLPSSSQVFVRIIIIIFNKKEYSLEIQFRNSLLKKSGLKNIRYRNLVLFYFTFIFCVFYQTLYGRTVLRNEMLVRLTLIYRS